MIDKIIDRLNILEDLLINKCEIDLELFQKVIKETQEIRELVLTIPVVGSSLPEVCTGCGSLSTKVIDKKYLACCPDNNYVPMEQYLKNSRYRDKWN